MTVSEQNTQAAIDAGIKIGSMSAFIQRGAEGVPFAMVHKDATLQVFSGLQQFEDARAERPRALSGMAQILTEQSMIDHILRFKDSHSVLFATASGVTAVYDYHEPMAQVISDGTVTEQPQDALPQLRTRDALARWQRHRAEYTPKLSREWDKWVCGAGRAMSQAEFADFLDENDQDVAGPTDTRSVPTQADLMTLGHTLKVTSEDVVEATIDRTTGNYHMVAKQDMRPTGECKIWKEFDILIPIFDGGEKIRICCKFRLQKAGGQLKFGWAVPTAARMLREEYYAMAVRVGTKAVIPVIFGTPEK